MRLTCDEARLLLWPGPGSGSAGTEASAALAHYRDCADCQRFFATQDRLGRRLRELARVQRAPRGLSDRVQAALASDELEVRRRGRQRTRRAAVLVGLAAAAALVLVLVRPPGSTDRLAQPFVEEALRDMPAEAPVGADLDQTERWFAERLGREIPVMEIPEATLMGGRITRVGEVPSAALRYQMDGTPLTYVVVPGQRVMDRPIEDGEVIAVASRGLEVVIWGEPGATHVVVASLPREKLKAIAEECRRKLRLLI